MSIPLTVRKGIRDSEPKLQENLQIINDATGKEWVCEVNWEENLKLVDASSHNQLGDTYYNQAIGKLALNIAGMVKKETAKEAFIEATSQNKITIKVNDKQPKYWLISIANGEVLLSHKKSIANISDVQYFNLIDIIPTPGIPLVTKLDIEESQPKVDEALQLIAEATGVADWVFEADYDKIVPQLAVDAQRGLGKTYSEMLTYFAKNLKKSLANEILKEAFVEAVSQKKVEIQLDDKLKNYTEISIKDGNVIIWHKKSIANLSNIEYTDLAPRVPVPGIPLVTRISMAKPENQTALSDALAKISKATGDEYALETNMDVILPQLEKETQDRIGDLYYTNVMGALSKMIEKKLQNETIKEAFLEATSSRKIIFQVNDKQKTYWNVRFADGTLFVEHKKTIANISDVEYYALETVIPVPGLSLVTKLNIIENRPKIDEALEKIKEATGVEYVFEADYDTIASQMNPDQITRMGSLYAEALTYFSKNVAKKMQNPLIKEAFVEATTERKICTRVNDKQNKYNEILFQNGAIILSHKKSFANLSDNEYDQIEANVPVPGILSLMAKMSLEENRKPLEESLQQIATATGNEFTFDEGCIQAFYPKLDADRQKNVGSHFFRDILKCLANNITRRLKDEMVKEAFNEITSNHQITVVHNPAQSQYWNMAFKDGNIVLTFKAIANVTDVEHFDFEKLL